MRGKSTTQRGPDILVLTGRKELSDSYFTQNVLPNYVDDHPDAHEWDVVFDDRGRFIEPHTGRSVGLGTVFWYENTSASGQHLHPQRQSRLD